MKKHHKKNILRELAQHLGIKVKFVHWLADDVHGKLLTREKRILINAHKPRFEHVYTLLHELGHFLLHFKSLPKIIHPRVFDINWSPDCLARFCSFMRRYFRFTFNNESGKEWQADLWAMCALAYLARHHGFKQEMARFLKRHPEKTGLCLLAASGILYSNIKQRTKSAFQLVWKPLGSILA